MKRPRRQTSLGQHGRGLEGSQQAGCHVLLDRYTVADDYDAAPPTIGAALPRDQQPRNPPGGVRPHLDVAAGRHGWCGRRACRRLTGALDALPQVPEGRIDTG